MMPFSKRHTALQRRIALFYPVVIAGATAFFAITPADAQMRLNPDCRMQEGLPENCAHVVACIGQETLFVGGAIGWNTGRVEGQMSTGAECSGLWDNATAQAAFLCDDGSEGKVQYLVQDGPTGTAIGQGEMVDGRMIEVWTGINVADYIRRETGEVVLQCGPVELFLARR